MAIGSKMHAVFSNSSLKRRIMLVAITVLLVTGIIVGGTMAWLVTKTDPVVNTFTYFVFNLELEETDTNDGDNNQNTNEYEMLPGTEIDKDPVVTVVADSVDSWLFVKLDKSANFDTFMEYTMAEGWTALPGVDGVFYRETTKADADQEFTVIKDNKVTVKSSVTKEMLNALDEDPSSITYPTLTVTAYAVQKTGFDTAEAAWAVALQSETP